jgi:hypothetical protein
MLKRNRPTALNSATVGLRVITEMMIGRSERIRTSDPLLPKQVRYQAALRSDRCCSIKRRNPEGVRQDRASERVRGGLSLGPARRRERFIATPNTGCKRYERAVFQRHDALNETRALLANHSASMVRAAVHLTVGFGA